jgi:hypothetical protein
MRNSTDNVKTTTSDEYTYFFVFNYEMVCFVGAGLGKNTSCVQVVEFSIYILEFIICYMISSK